ncbi:MAG: CHRD domain-containing protein [Trinickia sp.]|jgi:hypothetical protein
MHVIRKLNVAVLLWAVAAGAAFAETVNLKADLEPSSEVPPTTSKGHGQVQATFDTSSKDLKWKISYEGLSGPATMAHFHGPASVGQNAGVQVGIPKDKLASPIEGEKTLTDEQAKELMNGKWYFNVHTAASPSGEIRGQVVPAS